MKPVSEKRAKMMKGVDEFVYVLIAAIVVLGVLFLISPWLASIAGPPTEGEFQQVASLQGGHIGFSGSAPARKASIGSFDASATQSHNLRENKRLSVSRGLGGVETHEFEIGVPEFFLDSMRRVVIGFDIDDTNRYGNLQVFWNGKREYEENVGARHLEIEIPKERIDKKNTLKLDVTGPGLFFWASSVYILRDFSVDLETGPGKIFAFPLSKGDIESFIRGEIEFFGSGGGTLTVKLNGRGIYNDVPDGVTKAVFNFSTAPLIIGENILSFDADRQSMINGAKLSLFLLKEQTASEREFNITQEQLENLRKGGGKIDVNVNFIFREGRLGVALNGKQLGEISPIVGANALAFRAEDVVQGKNTLTLTGTGEFEVSSVKVGFLKK